MIPRTSSLAEHSRPLTSNPARGLAASYPVRVLALMLGHMLLALFMQGSALIATVHALLTFALAFYFLVHDERPDRLLLLIAYITAAELLWRGTGAAIFWESGKYGVGVLLVLRLLRERRLSQASRWPFFYFILLLPSILVLPTFNREDISFNLSGPFALAAATLYFSTARFNREQLTRLFLALLLPVVGLAFLAAFDIVTAENLRFVIGAKATAAGIGPNQVSSILGLGVLITFFYLVFMKRHPFLQIVLLFVVLWLVAQTALTLSRGGLWTGLLAVLVAALLLFRERRSRGIMLLAAVVIYLSFQLVLLPRLDAFSGGVLTTRLQDVDLTGRDLIVQADILTFQDRPLFGVGPGQSKYQHARTFRLSSAHTEYSRLLAEHGSFGAVSLLLLLLVSGRRFFSFRSSPRAHALVVALTVWSLAFMFHAAMRLVAPAFLFGLAAASFDFLDEARSD